MFPESLKHLHAIDNRITDEGLELMGKHMRCRLESLFISYNMLTERSIEILKKTSTDLKTLHISKYFLNNSGTRFVIRVQ